MRKVLGFAPLFAALVACASPSPMAESSASAIATECSAAAFDAPIVPPSSGAGVDLSAGGAWTGVTLATMEQALCAAHAEYSNDTDDYYSFGRGEFVLTVNREAGMIDYVAFNPGYTGTVSFKSRAGDHTYAIAPGAPVIKDGAPWNVDWRAADAATAVHELDDALAATFAPDLTPSAADEVLSVESNGLGSLDIYVGSKLLHFYVYFEADLKEPAGSVLSSSMVYMLPKKPGT